MFPISSPGITIDHQIHSEPTMIDRLARQLFNDLNEVFAKTSESLSSSKLSSSKLKVLIEANLRKLNLVTREEFDAQSAVLLRTREKLEQLEKQLAAIEDEVKGLRG